MGWLRELRAVLGGCTEHVRTCAHAHDHRACFDVCREDVTIVYSKAKSSRSVHASLGVGPSHTSVNIRTAPCQGLQKSLSPRTKSQLRGRALPPSRQRLRLTPRRSPTLTRIRTTRTPPYQRRVRATCVGWLAGGLGWVWVSGPGAARMWGPLWPPPLYGGGMPLPPAGERLVLRGASSAYLDLGSL